jgi:hypothetical protein
MFLSRLIPLTAFQLYFVMRLVHHQCCCRWRKKIPSIFDDGISRVTKNFGKKSRELRLFNIFLWWRSRGRSFISSLRSFWIHRDVPCPYQVKSRRPNAVANPLSPTRSTAMQYMFLSRTFAASQGKVMLVFSTNDY